MTHESPEVSAARSVVSQTLAILDRAPSFQQLDPRARSAILRDLGSIQQALAQPQAPAAPAADPYSPHALTPRVAAQAADPYALSLATPLDRRRRGAGDAAGSDAGAGQTNGAPAARPTSDAPGGVAATETIARRAGALSDEIDFPTFVAGLVHGAFDAIVDANIRQMETFADLVSAVAKDVDQFTRENITANQARDWLVQRYPNDLTLDLTGPRPNLRRRLEPGQPAEDAERSPAWLEDFGLDGAELTDDLIEEQLVPAARRSVGEQRLQMLATMVLMGMSRVNVRDGSISARLRFRAIARDQANVAYNTNQDGGGGGGWGARGSRAYAQHSTMVSTVGVNVQAESELKAELFGEVKINFASETLPLERFVDSALLTLLQRNARPIAQPGASRREPAEGGEPGAASQTPGLAPPTQAPGGGLPPAPNGGR